MTVLVSIINTWISEKITEGGISAHNLQKEKFARVEAVTNTPCAPSTKLGLVQLVLIVPNHVRAGSKEYFKESCKLLRHANTPVNTEEISEIIQVVKKEKLGPIH